MAGIVLTLGMAVDANVIIYERIKEEIRAGKGLRLAITDGYKNAYSAIVDGNVTTLLTGIVLYVFGTGPVQGFCNNTYHRYNFFTVYSDIYFKNHLHMDVEYQ